MQLLRVCHCSKRSNGTTAYAAIRLSKIEQEFEEIDIDSPIGIFGKILDGKSRPNPKEYVLQDNDRVIHRPLTVDPKKARLKRAASAGKKDRVE